MPKLQTYEDLKLGSNDKLYQITILGAHDCGKTSVVNSFVSDKKPDQEESKIKTTTKTTIKIMNEKDKNVYLRIFDPSGDKNFTRLRDLTIPVSEYVILMYAVDDREGFYEARQIFKDVVKRRGKSGVKVVACCTKVDKSATTSLDKVLPEEGKELLEGLNGLGFVETSAKDNLNIEKTFDLIIYDIVSKETPKKSGFLCC